MINELGFLIALIVLSAGGGFLLCLCLVLASWIKRPTAPPVHTALTVNFDEAAIIHWMRSLGYEVKPEARLKH